jgi:hypothetical protein
MIAGLNQEEHEEKREKQKVPAIGLLLAVAMNCP